MTFARNVDFLFNCVSRSVTRTARYETWQRKWRSGKNAAVHMQWMLTDTIKSSEAESQSCWM